MTGAVEAPAERHGLPVMRSLAHPAARGVVVGRHLAMTFGRGSRGAAGAGSNEVQVFGILTSHGRKMTGFKQHDNHPIALFPRESATLRRRALHFLRSFA